MVEHYRRVHCTLVAATSSIQHIRFCDNCTVKHSTHTLSHAACMHLRRAAAAPKPHIEKPKNNLRPAQLPPAASPLSARQQRRHHGGQHLLQLRVGVALRAAAVRPAAEPAPGPPTRLLQPEGLLLPALRPVSVPGRAAGGHARNSALQQLRQALQVQRSGPAPQASTSRCWCSAPSTSSGTPPARAGSSLTCTTPPHASTCQWLPTRTPAPHARQLGGTLSGCNPCMQQPR